MGNCFIAVVVNYDTFVPAHSFFLGHAYRTTVILKYLCMKGPGLLSQNGDTLAVVLNMRNQNLFQITFAKSSSQSSSSPAEKSLHISVMSWYFLYDQSLPTPAGCCAIMDNILKLQNVFCPREQKILPLSMSVQWISVRYILPALFLRRFHLLPHQPVPIRRPIRAQWLSGIVCILSVTSRDFFSFSPF